MPVTLYEHPAWQRETDQVMHPGGLTVTQQALSFCQLHPGAFILDIGCGVGTTLHYINYQYDCIPFGIDVSMNLLMRAHFNHPSDAFVQAKGECLPFANGSMDVVISECTLSLFEMDAALRECNRVLKQDGTLIISDVYARNAEGLAALRQLPPETCIGSAMSREQIEYHLTISGYDIVTWMDCSNQLKSSITCAFAEAASVDIFDLYIAAAKAKLGYYFLAARKVSNGRA